MDLSLELEEGISHIQFPPYLAFSAISQDFEYLWYGMMIRVDVCIESAVIIYPMWQRGRVQF